MPNESLWQLLAVISPGCFRYNFVLTTVTQMCPASNYSLDPIPLFFLALIFGVLYHRTHRLAPSLLLHMAFNATSVGAGLYIKIGHPREYNHFAPPACGGCAVPETSNESHDLSRLWKSNFW